MKLFDWIDQHSTRAEFAQELGRSRMQLHRYAKGENLTRKIVARIEQLTDGEVTAADFPPPTDDEFQPKEIAAT